MPSSWPDFAKLQGLPLRFQPRILRDRHASLLSRVLSELAGHEDTRRTGLSSERYKKLVSFTPRQLYPVQRASRSNGIGACVTQTDMDGVHKTCCLLR
jgi:hypothetical protein